MNKNNLTSFHFKMDIAMRWSDMDELGHINNAVFFTYLEEGRTHYLTQAIEWNWREEGLILARAEMDFKKPLLYQDKATLYMRCTRLGNTSFDLEAVITNENDPENPVLIAQAKTVQVCYDYKNAEAIMIPDHLRKRFALVEKWDNPVI